MDNIDEAIKLTPKDVTVASQNNILPHLANRLTVYKLSQFKKADYVLVDLHDGQSMFNYIDSNFTQEDWNKFEKDINELIESKKYELIYKKGKVYLIKKLALG